MTFQRIILFLYQLRARQGILLSLLIVQPHSSFSQQKEFQGWVNLSHTQKINNTLDVLFDAQTRTANQFAYASTLLLRVALNYKLNDVHAFALGVAYKGDREMSEDAFEYSNERRVYQQYLFSSSILKSEMMLRGRLEQRWLEDEGTNFSQRARLFISAQIPLLADKEFSRGAYAGVQNEIFLNVSNKKSINGRLLDQNRSFLSFGYRWNNSVDTEIGYMYWYQPDMDETFRRDVIQLQITTSF